MRILSQDGKIDVPYEQVVIQRFGGKIYYLNENLTGVEELINDIKIATYSTEQKAIKAMDMLHDIYESHTMYRVMNDKQRTFVETNFSGNKLSAVHGIFRFPQEDEV